MLMLAGYMEDSRNFARLSIAAELLLGILICRQACAASGTLLPHIAEGDVQASMVHPLRLASAESLAAA
jgi:hypothetical protein